MKPGPAGFTNWLYRFILTGDNPKHEFFLSPQVQDGWGVESKSTPYGKAGTYEDALEQLKLLALESQSDTVILEETRFPIIPATRAHDYYFLLKASLYRCHQ